uniref:Uncharacterized protein n=1 Tax=Avena sativa TaxID=4498 RepID=A0ACD5YGV4_AVESA
MDAAILQPRPRPRLPRTLPHGAWQWRHQAMHLCLRRRPVRRLGPRGAREEGVLLQLVLLLHQRGLPAVDHGAGVGAGQRRGWGVGFAVPLLLMSLGFGVFLAGRRAYRYRRPGERELHGKGLPGCCRGCLESPAGAASRLLCTASPASPFRGCRLQGPPYRSVQIFGQGCHCAGTDVGQGRPVEAMHGVPGGGGDEAAASVPRVGVLGGLLHGHGADVVHLDGAGHGDGQPRGAFRRAAGLHGRLRRAGHPVYDAALVPLARRATGEDRGISQPQPISVGLALSALAMAYSALLERRRRLAAGAVSIAWQAPAYAVLGAGEVFAAIGSLELFYDRAPDGMRSLCTALSQLAIAAGNYLNSAVLGAVAPAGWIPEDLDQGHLDYFFWVMAALGALNLLQFMLCSIRYSSGVTASR